ncbi:diacylglycerol kinase eta-like protein [Plakobranchus ocellatus]|uniref:Diacylglycerol kinase eta-like protein n=1 Tax=Plakobranchus ocellatus TaxID=259542 RepID=A0AAV3ZS63_9GAST|nr:diacylglycerol kinase eta-like protein [Plakobranchus ocellatus]
MAAPVAISPKQVVSSTKTRHEQTGQEESSDSDGETEPARIFHRRISTNRHIKTAAYNQIPPRYTTIVGWIKKNL